MHYWKLLSPAVLTVCLAAGSLPGPTLAAADPPATDEEQLANAIHVGQPQWLEAGGSRFLGIYTRAGTGTPLGGAIILPGLGEHADSMDVIAPLRVGLPDFGWSTLSITLPIPEQGTDGQWQLDPYFTASRARIEAAIAFMEQQGINNIALIGHGLGAAAAVVNVSGENTLKAAAFAAISLGIVPPSASSAYQVGLLENIHIPMLDIYGNRDQESMVTNAAARLAAARRGGRTASNKQQIESLMHSAMARLPTTEQNGYIAFRQLQIMGVDYRFRGAEQTLLRRIAGWLRKHAIGVALPTAALNP